MSDQISTDERPTVASAIITHNGKVLLVRRRIKEGSLSWQFPGGQIEQGESAAEAAVREVGEETGLNVAELDVIGARIHPNTGRKMVYVACRVVSGEATVIDDDELDDIAWVGPDNLIKYVPNGFYEPVQEYLDSILPT